MNITEDTRWIIENANQFSLTELEVSSKLQQQKSWDATYRQIMLLGKSMILFSMNEKRVEAEIKGCESQVWLYSYWQDGKLKLTASADSKIVRGLLAIVLAAFNNKSAEQIKSFDVESYFSTIGLQQQLSPSRSNGLNAIVNHIKRL